MRVILSSLLVVAMSAGLSFAQKGPTLTGEQILKALEAANAGVQDYAVNLEANIDLERLKVPKMNAVMYFKAPDKVNFKSEGFALLPKEGLSLSPGSLTSRFTVEKVARSDTSAHLQLTLVPKDDKTRLRRVLMAVDEKRWTIEEFRVPRFDGRLMKAEFAYSRVDGYWLPSQLTVTFASDTTRGDLPDPFAQLPANMRSSGVPRTGTIAIRYSGYRLNTGLSDDLFDKSEQK